jgi:hypothetical protein
MFCRYDEVAATGRWEVLARSSRSCGGPEPLATIGAETGETVRVPQDPRPDRLVIVRVRGIEEGVVNRVVTAMYRSPEWWATLDGDVSYRLVPGTAVDGLLLAAPESLRRSAGFEFGPPIRQLSIAPRGAFVMPAGLSYEFMSVPLARS